MSPAKTAEEEREARRAYHRAYYQQNKEAQAARRRARLAAQAAGKPPRQRCERCGEPVTTARSDARYCSERCRKAAWAQRSRARVRERHRQRARARYAADPARAAAAARDWQQAHPETQARYYAAMQEQTREEATHHYEPWEAHEIELACDRSVPIQDVALLLGRTRAAIVGIRYRTRYSLAR